jgi:alpha-tubulin suppressor-like RCC1 family protein
MTLSIRHLVLFALLSACVSEVAPPARDGEPETPPPLRGEPEGTPERAMPERPDDHGLCEGCRFVDLVAGNGHTCALVSDGSVRCWGGNRWGQLGDGSPRHGDCSIIGNVDYVDCSGRLVSVQGVEETVQLSGGSASSCALSAEGEALCWGRAFEAHGAMSQAVERNVAAVLEVDGPIVDVSEGSAHTCVVDAAGTVLCRGLSWAGQLGAGDFRDRNELTPVVGLPPAVDVETAASGGFTCAITEDGVYCWGDDTSGQLGDGASHETCFDGTSSYDCSSVPVRVRGLDAGEIAELSLGGSHACALTHEGRVLCWGAGARGQLGRGDYEGSEHAGEVTGLGAVTSIAAGEGFTCALTSEGRVACFGDDRFGQLGDGTSDADDVCRQGSRVGPCNASVVYVSGITDAERITTGSAHACALNDAGDVRCWGLNHEKQLGDGTRRERSEPVTLR